VSIAGITGTRSASADVIRSAVRRLGQHTDLPVAVGFGIQTPEQVREVVNDAAAAVVGSTLVREIEQNLDDQGNATQNLVNQVLDRVQKLSSALRS
jgi:tryptophan synthase alpha chain